MRLITPMTLPRTGKTIFAVWEYDETKPRNLEATDIRQRYTVKAFIDYYKTRKEAEASAAN